MEPDSHKQCYVVKYHEITHTCYYNALWLVLCCRPNAINITRNILHCDQSNGSLCIILFHICKAALYFMKVDHLTHSRDFKIFQDGLLPCLEFSFTGSICSGIHRL